MKLVSGAALRQFKAQAQRLESTFKIGHAGLSPTLVQAVDQAFGTHEVIKVKFVSFKEQKDELAQKLAESTSSQLIQRVGNVAVLCRPKPRNDQATNALDQASTDPSIPG